MSTKNTKSAKKAAKKTTKKSESSAAKTKTSATRRSTSKATTKKKAVGEVGVKDIKVAKTAKVSDSGNVGMGMARVISNTMGKYFSKFAAIAVICASLVSGCALISGMTTEQKADIAYTAARTATIAWVALDDNSTKYKESLSQVVSVTKSVVDSYCSSSNTDFSVNFYNECYAKIEMEIVAMKLDSLTEELSKSLAKFSVIECQKVIKLLKSVTPEESKEIVQHVINGIDSGLKVDVKSEEYSVALAEQSVASENEALKVKMIAVGAGNRK